MRKMRKMRLLDGGSLPPLSMLGRQNVTHVINTPSPYLPFCTLQAIKNWTVGRRLMSFLTLTGSYRAVAIKFGVVRLVVCA